MLLRSIQKEMYLHIREPVAQIDAHLAHRELALIDH